MKKMANSAFAVLSSVVLIVLGIIPAKAQEKVEVSVGADIVSNYIWRGIDCGGASIQPSISVAKSGFSLTAWGSTGFSKSDTKELDLTLGYSIAGFNVAITDYWFDTRRYFDYSAHTTAHIYEASVGYDFGVLAINWNTYFAGDDYYKSDGKRAYSSYLEASAPFKLGGVDFSAEIGLTPWEGAYSNKFNVINLGLTAFREIKITDTFNVPAFAKLIVNPNTEGAYFVFGVSL